MLFKKHWFWIAVSSIIISWIGNTLFFESKQIEAPIFLTHYIEESVGNPTFLSLYYITNKADPQELQTITMDGLTLIPQQHEYNGFYNMDVNLNTEIQHHQEFIHHYLKKATFEISKDHFSSQQLNEEIDVKKIEAVFTDGSTISAPIGHIRLTPNVLDSYALKNVSSSGSSDGSNRIAYSVSEALTIEEIVIPFVKETGKDYTIEFIKHNSDTNKSGEKIPKQQTITSWPLKLDEKDAFITNIQYNLESKNALGLQFIIKGETQSGKNFQVPIMADQQPYLTQADINAYIEQASEVE